MNGLELRGLTKRFGSVAAVDGLNLTAAPGELVALLGPSGCGKTTTLRMVAGFERPDRGRVLVDGQDITDLLPERRGVGIVFQNYALFPHMSVAENIGYGLALRGVAAGERRRTAEELLALVGLAGLGDRRPDALSAGQQQRVALARALAPRPRLLLLDEPLSALDAPVRRHLRAEIRRVQKQLGITTLYVTHDQEEALATADRIAVLREGRLEQAGAPEEVYLRPASPFVAAFIGDGNVWEARVEAAGAGRPGNGPPAGGGPDRALPLMAVRIGPQRWWVPWPGQAPQAPAPGAVVHVVVRPEQLRLLGPRPVPDQGPEADGRAVNRIGARLLDVQYLGASAVVRAAFEGGELRALVPGERVGSLRSRIGEPLWVAFEAGSAWVIPPPG